VKLCDITASNQRPFQRLPLTVRQAPSYVSVVKTQKLGRLGAACSQLHVGFGCDDMAPLHWLAPRVALCWCDLLKISVTLIFGCGIKSPATHFFLSFFFCCGFFEEIIIFWKKSATWGYIAQMTQQMQNQSQLCTWILFMAGILMTRNNQIYLQGLSNSLRMSA